MRTQYRSALALVLFAGLTDWFDGFAARRLKAADKLGVVLDPLADKILLVTLFVVLGLLRLIPIWMFCLVIGRDLVIVIGALLVRLLRGVTRLIPTLLGKVSTFFQIVLVLLVLCHLAFPLKLLLWLQNIGLVLCALFTVASGFQYVHRGIQMARRIIPTPR